MVYDCFIFNDELSLLKLRLLFLNNDVDKFVIVESGRTLSGNPKPLYFEANKGKFTDFQNKIIHLICPDNDFPAWEYEFYQRNYIKNALLDCSDTDIIFISDADEIINIREVLHHPLTNLPALIELPMYNYFVDLKTTKKFQVNLVATWSFLKDKDIGYRYKNYPEIIRNRILSDNVLTGWHFSYLYGFEIKKYQQKIRSFSHQEFNKSYYLNKSRILKCVTFAIDLYERPFMKLKKSTEQISPIQPFLSKAGIELYYDSPLFIRYLYPSNLFFIIKAKFYRRIKSYFQQLFNYRNIQSE